jgi:hypothetical protein
MPDCPSCVEVEVFNVDKSHPATQKLPAKFPTHDELYNQSRNPTELGIVHPLLIENEATMVGQINAGLGPLLNSDRHAMVYCRNFEGGRSFTTLFGHSWQLQHDAWYQQMLLQGIQTTAGVDGGAALKKLNEKGLELTNWMKGQ